MNPEQQRLAIMQALSNLGGVPQQPIPSAPTGARVPYQRPVRAPVAPMYEDEYFDPRRGVTVPVDDYGTPAQLGDTYERPTGEIAPAQLRTDELAPVYDALDERDERDSEPPPMNPAMLALRSMASR